MVYLNHIDSHLGECRHSPNLVRQNETGMRRKRTVPFVGTRNVFKTVLVVSELLAEPDVAEA